MLEEKEVLEPTEVKEEFVFTELLDDEDEEVSTTEEDNSKETESESTPDIEDERFKGKSVTDVIKAYKELEKLNGRQAQEFGELKKKVSETPKQSEQKTVDNLSLKELESTISYLDERLADNEYPETYKQDYMLKQTLERKRNDLLMENMINSTNAKSNNPKEFESFVSKYQGIPEQILSEIKEIAESRFANQFGGVSMKDYETAFFVSNRDLYDKNLQMNAEKKFRDSIANAGKLTSVPTINASESNIKTVNRSWSELYNSNPQEAIKQLDKLSPKELEKLLKKVK